MRKYLKMFLNLGAFFAKMFAGKKNMRIFATANAQMAESVDALVSNTSGATHPGSTPGLSTKAAEIRFSAAFSFSKIVSSQPYYGLSRNLVGIK